MDMNEAKSVLKDYGYELIDEGFFADSYTKYKNKVMALIKKYRVDLEKYEKPIEDWIRDYFLDKMSIQDCALAIRDNCKQFVN